MRGAGASLAAWPLLGSGARTQSLGGRRTFLHGIASGDPLADRVMLWTRVTPADATTAPVTVRWRMADDERLTRIVARGTAVARPERDFTVKVEAAGLRPGAIYYYAFDAGGEQSPVGRTRTLPSRGAARLRLGVVSCSDFERATSTSIATLPHGRISTRCCSWATTSTSTPATRPASNGWPDVSRHRYTSA